MLNNEAHGNNENDQQSSEQTNTTQTEGQDLVTESCFSILVLVNKQIAFILLLLFLFLLCEAARLGNNRRAHAHGSRDHQLVSHQQSSPQFKSNLLAFIQQKHLFAVSGSSEFSGRYSKHRHGKSNSK